MWLEKDRDDGYSKTSKVFHWIRVLLLISIYGTVWFSSYGWVNFNLHMVLGVSLFFVMIFNILWRVNNKRPKSDANSIVEENIQAVIYIIIYTVLFIIPIMGYLGLENPVIFSGLRLPWIYDSKWFVDFLEFYIGTDVSSFHSGVRIVHKVIAKVTLVMLISLHVGAIIFNIVVRKRRTLYKMLIKK